MKAKIIPFNVPFVLGNEVEYVSDAMQRSEFSGNGYYTKLCEKELDKITGSITLLTSSCTHALEMAAMLINIKPGDEVIMSSFNFVSAANAFVLRGAKIVFVDIKPDTLNIDENLIEEAITDRTRAILVMHYGSVPCEMDQIMEIAKQRRIMVVEDAAHCIGSYYKGRHLGTIGDLGTISFHATNNIQCGEGGALIINDPKLNERAEIIREKGTNRKQFLDGKVDEYTWVDIGSSYLISELSAAFLFPQLQMITAVNNKRSQIFKYYRDLIKSKEKGLQKMGNAHIYYIVLKSEELRYKFIKNERSQSVSYSFHYIPLHLSKSAKRFSITKIALPVTEQVSKCIVRLPLFYNLFHEVVDRIVKMTSVFLYENQ